MDKYFGLFVGVIKRFVVHTTWVLRVRSAIDDTHWMAICFMASGHVAKAFYSMFTVRVPKSTRNLSCDRLQTHLSCVWTSHGR